MATESREDSFTTSRKRNRKLFFKLKSEQKRQTFTNKDFFKAIKLRGWYSQNVLNQILKVSVIFSLNNVSQFKFENNFYKNHETQNCFIKVSGSCKHLYNMAQDM